MKKGFTTVEFLTASCVILLLVGIYLIRVDRYLRSYKEEALRHQLSALRQSLKAHHLLYQRYPSRLEHLNWIHADGDFVFSGGKFEDPFNNRFFYDSISGRVASTTPKYKKW